MAMLTSPELGAIRRDLEDESIAITYQKAQVNAAIQAIENSFETTCKAALNNAIETAAPGVFTAAQKRAMVKRYLYRKFQRGG